MSFALCLCAMELICTIAVGMVRKSRSYPTRKPSVVVDWTLTCSDRSAARRAITEKWLEEPDHSVTSLPNLTSATKVFTSRCGQTTT